MRIGVDPDNGSDIVEFSGGTAGNPVNGITFERTPDFSASGSYRWTQLVTTDNIWWITNAGVTQHGHKLRGVDNSVVYSEDLVTGDSPSVEYGINTNVEFHRSFAAQMYLMYRHTSTDSIWVPINVTDWGFEFTVRKTQGVWNFVGNPQLTGGTPQNTYEFPEWTLIYLNGLYVLDP